MAKEPKAAEAATTQPADKPAAAPPAPEKAPKLLKVTALTNINRDGKFYAEGETLSVPAEVAEHWQRIGSAEPA